MDKESNFLNRETLRQQAEVLFKSNNESHLEALNKELQIHQIELEIQNEQLRETQIELEAMRDKYMSLYEFAPVGYLTLNSDHLMLETNFTFAMLLGYSKRDLLNQKFTNLILTYDQDLFYFHRKECINPQSPQSCELRLCKKEGGMVWVQLEMVIDHHSEANESFRVTVNDISKLKEAEEKLAEQAQEDLNLAYSYLQAICEESPNIIFLKDTRLNYVVCNQKFLDAANRTKAEVIGRNDFDLFQQDEAEKCNEMDQKILETEQLQEFEREYSKPNGSVSHFVYSKFPVHGQSGELIGIGGVGTDITEFKRAQEYLRQSQKMEALGTLAGGIAHEFNNILAVMLGNIELCLEDLSSDHEKEKHKLEQVYEAGERAGVLTRQILTFSQVENIGLKPANLSIVIKNALNIIRSTIPAHIDIQQNLLDDLPNVMANVAQVHQLLLNLCSNACHAMEDGGGSLKISLEELTPSDAPSSCLLLTVEDSGEGIAEEIQNQIFDPFFTTKEVGKGTGLGLSMVHGIVKNHKGSISVKSRLGKGATFSLQFPTTTALLETKTTDASAPVGKTGRILIVEDESNLLQLYSRFLEKKNYFVSCHTNGVEALAHFKENPDAFDLIVTDQAMPNMTGMQLAEALLKIRPNLPIVLSTGLNDQEVEEDAQALGICQFLKKPLRLASLQETIERHLE